MKRLTDRQSKVFEFLRFYLRQYGYPPTVREIGEHFGFLWPAARGHLRSLEKKGLIRINPLKSRGIEILGQRSLEGIMVPIAGRIRAGRPLLAMEDIDAHILVDRRLFPSEGTFSLKVTGDSMRNAGILDGDYVIVSPRSAVENGGIGVVLIGDEATVKRVLIEDGEVVLKPENSSMEPVRCRADDVRIVGKVVGVIRKI
jgi:repressor LexA